MTAEGLDQIKKIKAGMNTGTNHIVEHIIPFFEEHPVVGSKHFNYLDFKSAVYIIKNKEHFNSDGKGLEKNFTTKEWYE